MADRLIGWLATKTLRWYVGFAVAGGLLAVGVTLPLHPSWHEAVAWALVGLAFPSVVLAITVATVTRDRNLIAEAHSLEDLRAISWTRFEELIAAMFRARRWQVVPTQPEADGGSDLIIRKGKTTAYVQCKRWEGQVRVATVRGFYGTMAANGIKEGFFVTTGEFTPEAERFAHSVGIQTIGGGLLLRYLRSIRREMQPAAAGDRGGRS